jgi:hypothetical protein
MKCHSNRDVPEINVLRTDRSGHPGVAMGYVSDAGQIEIQLRNDRCGQHVLLQQIPLDAIAERLYDRFRSVSGKFHGRIIAL